MLITETDQFLQSNSRNQAAQKADAQPYLNYNIFQRFSFSWVSKFIKLNSQKTFEQDMHPDLRETEQSKFHFEQLHRQWETINYPNMKSYPLARTILKTYRKKFIFLILLGLVRTILVFSGTAIIDLSMKIASQSHPSYFQIVGLLVFIFMARALTLMVVSKSSFLLELLGANLKYGMVGIIYNKALRVSIIRSKEFSVGSIVNNYEIDCEKLHEAMSSVQDIIILPLQIIIGVVIVYFIAGYAVVGGLMMIIFVGVLSYVLETKGAYFQEILMEKKDARMKLLNEVLNGIKYIKMNGWEQKFIEKVSTARKNETSVLRKKACITVCGIVNYLFGAQGILMATIGAYLYLGFEFNAQKMITLCSAFWVITWPLQRISWIVTTLSSSIISIKRIEKFLLSEEIDVSYIKKITHLKSQFHCVLEMGIFHGSLQRGLNKLKKNRTRKSM